MKKAITKGLSKKKRKKLVEEIIMDLFNGKEDRVGPCCHTCANCTCIGEGDHICIAEEPILVMEDYIPTDEYFSCGGADYEEL